MGKNGDPQTGWMKEGVLEQQFSSNNSPQFRVNLYCVGCGRA